MTEVLDLDGVENLVEIGRGGFGVVYRGTETDLNRSVAVKVLGQASAEISRRRLDRERRAMGVLSGHPNIVTIHRSGLADGRPYMVMEYLAGGSLIDRLLSTGPVPWPEAVEIGLLIGAAVESAHQAGVLHRDIKPANILLTESGIPKLGDFGIADVESVSQTSGVMKATIAHAPPEILAGNEADARSDVYSLASTLYELISGSPAFVRPTDTSPVPVLMRITTEPVPDIDLSLAPPAITRCLQQAMAKEPAHRHQSAAHFVQALGEAAGSMGAKPAGPHLNAALGGATQVAPAPAAQPAPSSAPHQAPNPPQFASPPAQPHNPTGPAPQVQPHYAAASSGHPPVQPGGWGNTPPTGLNQGGNAPRAGWMVPAAVGAVLVLVIGAAGIWLINRGDGETDTLAGPAVSNTSSTDQTAAGDAPQADTATTTASTIAATTSSETSAPDPQLDVSTVEGRIQAFDQLAAGDYERTGTGYDTYRSVTDPTGTISVTAPTAWGDQANTEDFFSTGLQLGADIAATEAGRAASGVGIFVYEKDLLEFSTTDALLDLVVVNDFICAREPRVDFDHRLFSGRYQILHSCDAADPTLMSIQMIGDLKADTDFVLQISIVITSGDDLDAGQEVLDTAQIDTAGL